jgi:hypothetical protein
MKIEREGKWRFSIKSSVFVMLTAMQIMRYTRDLICRMRKISIELAPLDTYSLQQATSSKNESIVNKDNPVYVSYANQGSTTPTNTLVLPDANLGYGIRIGGYYQKHSLKIIATPWAESFTDVGYVMSGWLFAPELTFNHAVAFFKIHLTNDRDGYIHIADVAHPPHNIWLSTDVETIREEEFHYTDHPTAMWHFKVK